MIITKLEGGHSNQLFQYAAGRRLAHKLGVKLYMDKHWFSTITEGDTPRFYELDGYKFEQNFIDKNSFALAEKKPQNLKVKLYNLTKGGSKPRIEHIRQHGNSFNKQILDLGDNVYLEGWWQDERYFKDIRPLLLKEIELRTRPNTKNAAWLKQIKSANSVSIHIRRGDYVTNEAAKKFHGLMGPAYYQKALDQLNKKTGQSNFKLFVFSNDIEWCKQNLNFKYATAFIDGYNSGAEDMRLMKNCKHNIMANSSFSWWGAWLNQNPDKVIIAPKVWFLDKKANSETEIIPDNWLRI
jgi:hypothetical protein